jgi:hypothetical protein
VRAHEALQVLSITKGQTVARTKRRTPYDPNKPHDRRATESNRGVVKYLTPEEVDDPYEAGAKIMVMRSTRNDPLAGMHARKTIDEAQYWGGRAFQRDFEAAERGPCAIDPSKEFVDGGTLPEPITQSQQEAAVRLAGVYRELGPDGSALLHDVLIHARSYRQIAEMRGLGGERWEKFYGMSVHLHLHRLAWVYGFAKEPTGKRRVEVDQ